MAWADKLDDSIGNKRSAEVGKSKLFGDVDKSDRCWMLDLYVCVRVWLARFGLMLDTSQGHGVLNREETLGT